MNAEKGEAELLNPPVKNAQYKIYNALLNLYNNNNKKDEGRLPFRLLKRLLNNLVSTNGWEIATFFHNHTAATKPEIQKVTRINWQSTNTTVNIFVETGFLKILGHVGLPYRTRGRPIPIYGLHHATPEDAAKAQKRYGELRRSDREDPRQRQLEEAIAFCKTYMNDRGLKTFPDSRILKPMLQAAGIYVHTDRIFTALRKEGYSF